MTDGPTTIDEYIGAFPDGRPDDPAGGAGQAQERGADRGRGDQLRDPGVDGRRPIPRVLRRRGSTTSPCIRSPRVTRPSTKQMAPYVAGKGTLKFPLSEPIPYDLIERVAARLLDERTASDP